MHHHSPQPCSPQATPERNRYFAGKLLTESDLAAEQAYFVGKQRTHNRLLHGHGTVCGLGVTPTRPESSSVVVQPGMALDCCGREIVVTQAVEVDPSELLGGLRAAGRMFLTVAYAEMETAPVPVPGAGETSHEAARVRETVSFDLTDLPPAGHDSPLRMGGGCPPCEDPRVVLAALDLSKPGTLGAAQIDHGVRRIVDDRRHPEDVEAIARLERRIVTLERTLVAVGGAGVVTWLARRRS